MKHEIKGNRIAYTVFGKQILFINFAYYKNIFAETVKAKKIQDNYDLKTLREAKKLILFVVPASTKINGGIMSIYSLCETSRMLNPDSLCIISTYPNSRFTYSSNDKFLNYEQIYRFDQITEHCRNLESLILHIPEYYSKEFYGSLKQKDKDFFRNSGKVHINILNQNIELMPDPMNISSLYEITHNITQTLAHNRYATQEVCDKWQIPTHLFSVSIDLSRYKIYNFENKEKIIVLSPDTNKYRDRVIAVLKEGLPEWKIITVNNLTFAEYMDLISRAFFTVTFGEGMDGYLNQPIYKNSLGLAVYNEDFFPGKSWMNLRNIYPDYETMIRNICSDLQELYSDSDLYYKVIEEHRQMLGSIYVTNNYVDNLRRFYLGEYDFFPAIKGD